MEASRLFTKRVLVTLGIGGFIVAVISIGLLVYLCLSRPIFYEWVGFDDKFRIWNCISPIDDRKGTYAYADFELNMLVVIITKRNERFIYVLPQSVSRTEARLLVKSDNEILVKGKHHALIVYCRKDIIFESHLRAGRAKELYSDLVRHCGDSDDADVIAELLRNLEAPEKSDLETKLERQCSK